VKADMKEDFFLVAEVLEEGRTVVPEDDPIQSTLGLS
jgi:hypothetical protein